MGENLGARIRLLHSYLKEEETKARRPWREYILIALLVCMAVVVVAVTMQKQVAHFRQMMVRQEVMRIRAAVLFYAVLYRSMPPDIATLAKTIVEDPKSGQRFPILEDVKIDKNGQARDPLGYPYRYDKKNGKVSSTSPCCLYW